MEQAETQTQTTQTATEPTNPAPATAVADKPAQAQAAAESKPQTQTGESKTATADPKELARQAFKSREQKREAKAAERIAELEKQLAELKQAKPQPQAEVAPPSFLDDPDKWAQNVTERARQEALAVLQQERAEVAYRQSAENAANWLLTRKHLKEDHSLTVEVARAIESKYAQVAAADPNAAARLAYLDVCEAKGISPDMGGFKPGGFDGAKGQTSSGARPSAPAEGKRTFKRGEGQAYIYAAKPGSAEFKRRMAEVDEAEREGRVI